MGSMMNKATEELRREAAGVFEDLVAVLAAIEVKLPSAAVDWRSVCTSGVVLIDLGAASPVEVAKLVEALRRGARS
ncbi:hypothetical protein ACFP3U_05345 [Kitasatospora misakiensis]|uniref:Uncharacterized protein n=1 Tax=Kitasatospora misakiensis TaxID=67330 RepID=A0ABW0X0B8_9ACTN